MGMQQRVVFESSDVPEWQSVRELLASRDYPMQLRMVGTELTYPNELPPLGWSEIRVGRKEGMVTIRRRDNCLDFVTWGDNDLSGQAVWNAVTWAFAHLGGGVIQTSTGEWSAGQFLEQATLPGQWSRSQ